MHKDELLKILSYCDLQTIISVSTSCRNFNRFTNENYFWRSLCERDYGDEYKYFDKMAFKEIYKSCVQLDEYRLNIPGFPERVRCNKDVLVRHGKDEDRSDDIIAITKLCPASHSFYDVGEVGDAVSLDPDDYTFIHDGSKVYIFEKDYNVETWDFVALRVPLKYWCGGDYDYNENNFDWHGEYNDDTIGILPCGRTKFKFQSPILSIECIKQVNISNDERIRNHENVYKIEIPYGGTNVSNHVMFLRMLSFIEKLDRQVEYISFWDAEIYVVNKEDSTVSGSVMYNNFTYQNVISYKDFRIIFHYWGNFLWVRQVEFRS